MNARLLLQLTLAGLFADAVPAVAQVALLSTDVMHIGDRYRMAVDDMPTVDFGQPGANMVWNFNDLNTSWDYTLETMLAIDAPLGPVAPGAIAVVSSLDNAAYHFDVDADELLYTGDSWDEDGTPMGMAYTPPRVQLQFPAQMGQQHSSTSRSVLEWHEGQDIGWGFVVDSVRRRTHYAYEYAIDGWGQLFTPFGFCIAIRVNTLITTTDSIDAKPMGSSTWITDVETMDMTTREVTYWSPNHSLPVLRLLDLGDWGFVSNAVWIAEQELSTAVPVQDRNVAFSVFPNPAVDVVQVQVDGEGAADYRVLDARGVVVMQGVLPGGLGTVPVDRLEPGMYIMRVDRNGRTGTQRIMVQ